MSQILQTKISAVRRKHAAVAVAVGVAAALGAFALILGATMLLDLYVPSGLPFGARAALLAINLAAVVWILLYAAFAPVLYGPDDDDIALMVEDAQPAFRTRLIASVQLSRQTGAVTAGSSPSLVRAMIAQAESLAGPMDFATVVKTERLLRVGLLTLAILLTGGALLAWGGETSGDLIKRAFLSNTPVPRKTRVLPITDDLLIARGDSVELSALAEGVIPPSGLVSIKTAAGRKQEFTLDRATVDDARLVQTRQTLAASPRDSKVTERIAAKIDASSPVFAATVENVQEPFEYTIRLNDAVSQTYKVNVLPRPAVTRVEARQIYPAYTGRPIEPRPLGDLALLQGSKLQLAITVNKNLRRPAKPSDVPNSAHLIGPDKNVPLVVDPQNPKLLTGTLDLPKGTTGFSINLTDEFGLRSKDPALYRVDLVADKPPAARIVVPTRKEVLLVREARHKIVFEATDDFAIGAARIKFKVDEGSEAAIDLDLKGQHPKSFRGEYDWKLTDIHQSAAATRPMLEGSVIEYWVEVEDTKDAPNGGPGKGVSEHYMIRVVSEAEKRAEMAARIADIGSGLRTAADDQEAVANKVGTLLLEKKPEPAPK